MLVFNNHFLLLFAAFIVVFVISYGVMGVIIKIFRLKNLVDKSDGRTFYEDIIPTFYGLGIFIGFNHFLVLFLNFKID